MPDCKNCGHPFDFHADRAVAACSTEEPPVLVGEGFLKWGSPKACTCTGYEAA